MSARQFGQLRAAALYCRTCAQSRPVRERLLIVLPEREVYEYDCETCGESVGRREVSATEQLIEKTLEEKAARLRSGPQVRLLE